MVIATATLPVLDGVTPSDTVRCLVCESEVLRSGALCFTEEIAVCTTCGVEIVRVRVNEILAFDADSDSGVDDDDDTADEYPIEDCVE